MGGVTKLTNYKLEKAYRKYYVTMGNLCLNHENPNRKERDIKKELISGYMRLLTNYINKLT